MKDILQELKDWIQRFPKGDGFPTADSRNILQTAADTIDRLRRMNIDLCRRCQQAESVANETVEKQRQAGGSLGRSLANYAASQAQRELEEARAEIARLNGVIDSLVVMRTKEMEKDGKE